MPEESLYLAAMAHTEKKQLTAAEYRQLIAEQERQNGKNKYGAERVKVGDHLFDSQAEKKRYDALLLWEQIGKITDLELQPPFDLHALGGEKIGVYKADFRYIDVGTGKVVIEDVKGGKATQTDLFKWKRKHFEAEHGIKLHIVTK